MKKILLILVFVVSFLGAADLVGVDSNNTIQTVIEEVADKSSIANNATVNILMYSSIEFFEENIIYLIGLIIFILTILYFSNSWIRIFIGLFIFHILYQIFGINMNFPTIDIMYYGFAAWNISLIIRSFHKYFEKFENKNLVTKVNLFLHIVDIIIFILTLAFFVKSFNIQNVEVVTTGIGLGFIIIIRKDLNNLKSFFIISWDNFLSIGDKIIIDNKEGRILYISKFTSILQAENGNLIKVPNSDLVENNVINKSKNKNHLEKEIK